MAPLVTPLREAQLGGAQAFVTDLARGLQARGHAVTVHCAEGSDVPGLDLRPVPVGDVSSARVRADGAAATGLPAMREAFRRLYRQVAATRPDAVTQHAFDAEAIEEAEDLSARVLHTLHLPPISAAVRAAAQRTRRPVATVSRAAAAAWAAAGVAAGVLLNGVPDFDPGAPPVEPWALIAGRVAPEKQTHAALRLAERAGLEPVVVGPVYDAAYAAEHGLRARPALPRPELWRLMASCAVTLLPVDWEEPFGLVAAESQVAGCPVVGYRRGGLPEVVAEGVGGYLVDPGDEAALVAAVAPARRLERAAVRESARARLLIERCVRDYEEALCSPS